MAGFARLPAVAGADRAARDSAPAGIRGPPMASLARPPRRRLGPQTNAEVRPL